MSKNCVECETFGCNIFAIIIKEDLSTKAATELFNNIALKCRDYITENARPFH